MDAAHESETAVWRGRVARSVSGVEQGVRCNGLHCSCLRRQMPCLINCSSHDAVLCVAGAVSTLGNRHLPSLVHTRTLTNVHLSIASLARAKLHCTGCQEIREQALADILSVQDTDSQDLVGTQAMERIRSKQEVLFTTGNFSASTGKTN